MTEESRYITINSIGDHAVGDILTISGTTNLPVNTTLWIQAGPKEFTKYPPHYIGETAQVVQGINRNLWSIEVNTSTFAIDEYSVLVSPLSGEPVFGKAEFKMTGRHTGSRIPPSATLATIPPEKTTVADSPTQLITTLHPATSPTTATASLPFTLLFVALGITGMILFGIKNR
ncbi:hypothetical protein [Methanoregula formicica]|nr:hypothetical protein [Methanoregula formicica]